MSRSPEETKALVEQTGRLIERIQKLQRDRDEAQAALEVVRRLVGAAVEDADRRDQEGLPCWCDADDLGLIAGGANHEMGCQRLRSLTRKLAAALEVKP